MDPAFFEPSPERPVETDPETLDLFAPPPVASVDVPRIETPAPVAPGSATSQAAADAIDGPFRRASYRKILTVLVAASRPLSREAIAELTGIKESSLCARLSDRELRPTWVQCVPGACISSAGVSVDGYVATQATRDRMARRIA